MNADEMREVLSDVEYLDWTFEIEDGEHGPCLRVAFDAPDLETKVVTTQHGRRWALSTHMTKSELVATAFKAVITAVEHEAREAFRWHRRPIYSPHLDVAALWDVAKSAHMDVRPMMLEAT